MAHASEIEQGERFAFGKNWSAFLRLLDDERIVAAETSLKTMLGVETLAGKTFLDIGSGSGLFSLAARRLGARVHSIDYDPQSVACTSELRRRSFPGDADWIVEEGSAIDSTYMNSLSTFDVVYSWGVLHHTGAMWLGIEHAIARVNGHGRLFIAIYNDQGWKSHLWWLLKLTYNKLPAPLATLYAFGLGLLANLANLLKYTLKLKPMIAIRPWLQSKRRRGMSPMHDLFDWMGGFPFEFSRYSVLRDYMQVRGFTLLQGKPATSLGCHEMVFGRIGVQLN